MHRPRRSIVNQFCWMQSAKSVSAWSFTRTKKLRRARSNWRTWFQILEIPSTHVVSLKANILRAGFRAKQSGLNGELHVHRICSVERPFPNSMKYPKRFSSTELAVQGCEAAAMTKRRYAITPLSSAYLGLHLRESEINPSKKPPVTEMKSRRVPTCQSARNWKPPVAALP